MVQILQGAGESCPHEEVFLAAIAGNIGAGYAGKRRNDGKKVGYARYSNSYARYLAFPQRFRAKWIPVRVKKTRQTKN
jgi:hypothetical protein